MAASGGTYRHHPEHMTLVNNAFFSLNRHCLSVRTGRATERDWCNMESTGAVEENSGSPEGVRASRPSHVPEP